MWRGEERSPKKERENKQRRREGGKRAGHKNGNGVFSLRNRRLRTHRIKKEKVGTVEEPKQKRALGLGDGA